MNSSLLPICATRWLSDQPHFESFKTAIKNQQFTTFLLIKTSQPNNCSFIWSSSNSKQSNNNHISILDDSRGRERRKKRESRAQPSLAERVKETVELERVCDTRAHRTGDVVSSLSVEELQRAWEPLSRVRKMTGVGAAWIERDDVASCASSVRAWCCARRYPGGGGESRQQHRRRRSGAKWLSDCSLMWTCTSRPRERNMTPWHDPPDCSREQRDRLNHWPGLVRSPEQGTPRRLLHSSSTCTCNFHSVMQLSLSLCLNIDVHSLLFLQT